MLSTYLWLCVISIANALEIQQSCVNPVKPSICVGSTKVTGVAIIIFLQSSLQRPTENVFKEAPGTSKPRNLLKILQRRITITPLNVLTRHAASYVNCPRFPYTSKLHEYPTEKKIIVLNNRFENLNRASVVW